MEKRHTLQESHHSRGEVGADIEVNIHTCVKILRQASVISAYYLKPPALT